MGEKLKIVRRAFNAGEIAHELRWRNDIEKHASACEKLENFIVTPQGGIKRRTGTQFLADITGSGENARDEFRVVPFEFNRMQSYILLFWCVVGSNEVKLTVLDTSGTVKQASIATVFTRANLHEVQFKQINDVVYFSHNDFPPQKLSRVADTTWTMEEVDIKWGPLLDWNVDSDVGFTVSAPLYDATQSYNAGAAVYVAGEASVAVTGFDYFLYASKRIKTGYRNNYRGKISASGHSFSINDSIVLKGITGSIVFDGNNGPTISFYDGCIFDVCAVEENFIYVDLCTYVKFMGESGDNSSTVSVGASANVRKSGGSASGVYSAIQNVPANTAITDTAYWMKQPIISAPLNVQSTAAFFSADRVGQLLAFSIESDAMINGSYSATEKGKVSDSIVAAGEVSMKTEGGVWGGTLALQRSDNNGATWYTVGRVHSATGDNNEEIKREVDGAGALFRVYMEDRFSVTDDSGCKWVLSSSGSADAIFLIDSVVDSTHAVILPTTPLNKVFTTRDWAEGAFCAKYGYPRCVEVHEERLAFASNKKKPCTVWLSTTNDWENFYAGSLETAALAYTLASDEGEPINWMRSRGALLLGTGVSEWSFGSGDAGAALTQSSVKARNESDDGTEYLQPVKAANMLFYVKRGGRKLAAISYDYVADGYLSSTMTTLAPHILGTGVRAMFNQLSPEAAVTVVRRDGQMASFVFDKDNAVSAWSRLTFGLGVHSACAISTGVFKSVFLVVKRKHKTTQSEHWILERLDPEEVNTGAGLGYFTDCRGSTDFASAYESTVLTTPIVADKTARVSAIKLFMQDSTGGRARVVLDGTAETWCDVLQNDTGLGSTPIKTSRFDLRPVSGYNEDIAVEISSSYDAPFHLCALGLTLQTY